MYMRDYEAAVSAFRRAVTIQPHDATFLQLGKVYTLQEDNQVRRLLKSVRQRACDLVSKPPLHASGHTAPPACIACS